MQKIIDMKNITWYRGTSKILENIHWDVNPGEHWAIIGLNGSGKTSLLNIVTGYQFPSHGDVKVLGVHFGKGGRIPDLRRKIGYVSSTFDQFSEVFYRQSLEEIIVSGVYQSFGLYQIPSQEEWDRVDVMIRDMKIEHLKGRDYITYSQGEKQKVKIARALMANPKILILDEPAVGLDLAAREDLLDLMGTITKSGATLLYVTHHIEEITESITHALLLKDGHVVAQGPKQDVLTNETLSKTYGVPIRVRWDAERPWISVLKK